MDQQAGTELGLNKTGIKMSPLNSKATIEGAEKLTTPPAGDSTAIAENRIFYMREADPIGSVPIPASVRGILASAQEKLKTGNHSFMDKLGERLAFERTGTRLYEGLLSKYMGSEDKENLPPLETLEQFYHEELLHFYMVSDVITELGGDPTAVTPSADICAVASQGWVKIITDPRTTFAQSLEAILMAELVDNAGWELLIELAEGVGLTEIAQQFQQALEEESVHLAHVKDWVTQLTSGGSAVVDVRASH